MSGRQKKCRHCGDRFQAFNSLHRACSPQCAIEVARADAQKAQRKANKERKAAIKPRGELLKEAQTAFNAYIRERDQGKPCISCGSYPNDEGLITGSRIDAGHYRSTGAAPELRFDEANCHAQCVKCNRQLSGNAVDYRIGLIKRIGQAEVERLEATHEAKKYSANDLREIRDHYRAKARELRRETET